MKFSNVCASLRHNHFNKLSIVQQLHAEIARLKHEKLQDHELLERTQQLEALCEHYKLTYFVCPLLPQCSVLLQMVFGGNN